MSKPISLKMFLHRASRTKSAAAFLEGHRGWLETGELADEATPILAKLDANELQATPSLEALCQVAAGHMLAQIQNDAERPERQSRSEKPYIGIIKDTFGNVVTVKNDDKEKELRAGFDRLQDAERWTQRRLSETNADWNAEVICANCIGKDGKPVVFKTSRVEAIRAQAPKKKSPFMHQRRSSGGFDNTKVPVNPTHVRFSRG